VLGRSSVNFRGCSTGPDKTVSLLQGKTTKLLVSLNEVDSLDAPWTAKIRYEPPLALEPTESASRGKPGNTAAQPWTREFTIPYDKKTIAVEADKAGDYTIVSVRGSSCPGEVLNPETCRVIEQPLPTAEIEFKSIHEW
jgi:nucleoporin POM152